MYATLTAWVWGMRWGMGQSKLPMLKPYTWVGVAGYFPSERDLAGDNDR